MKINIFFDMDGVTARYHPDTALLMNNEGFFLSRPAVPSIIAFIKQLIAEDQNVFSLSTLTPENSERCKQEKIKFNSQHLPELSADKQIYVPYGTNKAAYLKMIMPDAVDQINVLYDDYTKNLIPWTAGNANFIGIKVLNGLNGTNGVWLQSGMPFIAEKDTVEQMKANLQKELKKLVSD